MTANRAHITLFALTTHEHDDDVRGNKSDGLQPSLFSELLMVAIESYQSKNSNCVSSGEGQRPRTAHQSTSFEGTYRPGDWN